MGRCQCIVCRLEAIYYDRELDTNIRSWQIEALLKDASRDELVEIIESWVFRGMEAERECDELNKPKNEKN